MRYKRQSTPGVAKVARKLPNVSFSRHHCPGLQNVLNLLGIVRKGATPELAVRRLLFRFSGPPVNGLVMMST